MTDHHKVHIPEDHVAHPIKEKVDFNVVWTKSKNKKMYLELHLDIHKSIKYGSQSDPGSASLVATVRTDVNAECRHFPEVLHLSWKHVPFLWQSDSGPPDNSARLCF